MKRLTTLCLVSAGRHPVSSRPRAADADARAVEIALCLGNADVSGLYAGPLEDETALREYLGIGLPSIHALQLPETSDILRPVTNAVQTQEPDIVLSGAQAETGLCSGLLPYLIADATGYGLISQVIQIEHATDDKIDLMQALPFGKRRKIRARLPLVLTVSPHAPEPRQFAYKRARRGEITVQPCAARKDDSLTDYAVKAYRPRPIRLLPQRVTGNAKARLAAAYALHQKRSTLLDSAGAAEAATAILAYLHELRLAPVREGSDTTNSGETTDVH